MQAELYIQLSKHDGRLAHPQPWVGLLDLGTNMVQPGMMSLMTSMVIFHP